MKFSTFVFSLLTVVGVMAQAPVKSTCEAQYILDACVEQFTPRRLDCEGGDWECMCQESRNIRTCYNNCPDDILIPSIDTEVIQWCMAMSATMTSTPAAVAATPTVTLGFNATTTGNSSETATSTKETETEYEDEPTPTSDDAEEEESSASATSDADDSSSGVVLHPLQPIYFAIFLGVIVGGLL